MHNSCLGISPKYLMFRNAPDPTIIDLYGKSTLCTNFENFTIFSAIVLIDCTYSPDYTFSSLPVRYLDMLLSLVAAFSGML